MSNPYHPKDPFFSIAPNPKYFLWELKQMGKQYNQIKKQFRKEFMLEEIIKQIKYDKKLRIEKDKISKKYLIIIKKNFLITSCSS